MERIVLPTFLICGVQKGGTTLLHSLLGQHPAIGVSHPKEIHFFTKDENYQKGFEWYSQFFLPLKDYQHRGEATPHYYHSEKARQRIRKDLPSARFLFILRNPVDRTYSHYWHHVRYGHVYGETFLEALANRSFYVANSMYAKHLLPWFKEFSRNQLCVLLYEALIEHPQEELKRVWEFLEVDPILISVHRRVNKGESPKFLWFSKTIHAAYARMSRMIPERVRSFVKSTVKPIFYRKGYPPLDPEVRKMLIDRYFRDDILQLQELIGRDLSRWLE